MGYFSNGSEGSSYEEMWCDRCVHQGPDDGPGCSVWFAHLIHNYDECNNPDSVLHMLIPRGDDGRNEQCSMFIESDPLVAEEAGKG